MSGYDSPEFILALVIFTVCLFGVLITVGMLIVLWVDAAQSGAEFNRPPTDAPSAEDK